MKRNSMYRLVFATAAAALFVTSAPVFASDADDQIESSFKKSYVVTTYLKDDDVKIKAKDGVATLSGTVSGESHKLLALNTASSVPGVRSVISDLSTKAEAAAENADVWMGRKVSLALLFHRNVNAVKTEVAVKDGVVTLKGEASSLAQKELTTSYAQDIEGVKEVKNEMTIASMPAKEVRTAGEKMDDASISAQVQTALLTHRSTSSITTKVITREGEVTLTGIAKNAAEKSLVTKLVTDIQGVSGVNNEMTVEDIKKM